MKLLFIGDIVGSGGREAVRQLVPELRREYNIQFVVANGENSAGGNGITAGCYRELRQVVNVITLGDHTWDQKGFEQEISACSEVVRPANYAKVQPGKGFGVFTNPAGGDVAVIALQGKVFMRESSRCPFEVVEEILAKIPPTCKTIIVDFHAEATSEKLAMQHFLDGRVTAVIGTHTHVQTADARVSASGTAMLTDVGMTGAEASILGREIPDVLHKFTTGMPGRLNVVENGTIRLDGAIITYDYLSGRASAVETISRTIEV